MGIGIITKILVLTSLLMGNAQSPELEFVDLYYTPTEIVETATSVEEDVERVRDNVPLSASLQKYINELCKEYGVSQSLVYAVIEKESSFHADSISAGGDYGLMQINIVNHDTWYRKGIKDFLNPYDNVYVGIRMLSSYGVNEADSLMCYSLGVGKARSWWEQGIHETDYTKRVLEMRKKYE